MTLMLEREVKLRFETPDEARAAILAAGATPLRCRRFQEDALLDTEDEMLRRRPSEYVAPIHIADAYVAMGDRTRACDFFEQALTDRNAALAWGPNTPFYDVIRDEPRFAAVMKHVRP